jgi:hypothetical protein
MATFNNDRAEAEGWGVFLTDRGFEIQRDDERRLFADDDEAIEHVWTQARVGSEYHQAALDIINDQERA